MKINVAQRVVVMGKEGSVRDQLVNALSDLGVIPIWVGKPIQSNPEQLAELNPNRVVVSLEPSIELELEPYVDFLSQQTLTVLYDDAETTRALSGWDLNRWARNMAAKLLDKEVLANGLEAIDSFDEGVSELALSWNESDLLTTGELSVETQADMNNPDGTTSHTTWQDTEHYEALNIDSDELNRALELLNTSLSAEADTDAEELLEYNMDSDALQFIDIEGFDNSLELNQQILPETKVELDADDFSESELPRLVDNDFVLPAVEVDTAKQHEVVVPIRLENQNPIELSIQSESEYESVVSGLSNQTDQIPSFDLSKYSLLDEQQDAITDSDVKITERKSKALWLVLSGLGGPVVMRDMLSKIKADFNGVIVIAHNLDSRQLPKFCEQLQKISKVPLLMLETDEFLKNAYIYFLTNNQTIQNTSLGYQCIDGSGLSGYIHQMDQNVEIVILSGVDPLLSQSLIQVSSQLHNIHVQSPEDCFEPSLAQLLVDNGVPVMSQDVLEKWFN